MTHGNPVRNIAPDGPHRERAALLRHRQLDRLAVREDQLAEPRERVELAARKRGAALQLHHDAPERQHVRIARLALRRLLSEEAEQPLRVARLNRRDDVGVALLVRPRITAAVIPEIGASDRQVDRVASTPDEHARHTVRKRNPLVTAPRPRKRPLDRCADCHKRQRRAS